MTYKLNQSAYEAQFHNHDHYKELDQPDPEWWEIPHKAHGGSVDKPVVARALAIARKANAR